MKKLAVPIKGMHCRACEITLTDNLEKLPDIKKAEVSLHTKTAILYAKHMPPQAVILRAIQKSGYDIGYDKKPWFSKDIGDYKDLLIGVVVVGVLALIVSRLGIAQTNTGNLVSGGVVVALLIGLTAGLSTCMALVGGLVLGLSAKHAKQNPDASAMQKFRPHLYFNLSRIISFFILGGLIGALGAVFQLRGATLGALTIGVGIVMLLLGLQLTNVFPRLSGGGLTLPPGLARILGMSRRQEREYSHKNSAVLGAASFFLPCGFTQAMQIYAISTGRFMTGALVMSLFALGTAPALLGVGGLTSVMEGAGAKRLFKITGVAVVLMALLNISNGYNLTGWPQPFSNTSQAIQPPEFKPTLLTGEVEIPQEVTNVIPSENKLKAQYTLASGLVPTDFTVSANQEYVLEVDPLEDGVGCMSTILIPGLNNDVQYLLRGTVNKLPFKASRPGTYQITCAMGVPFGNITVI